MKEAFGDDNENECLISVLQPLHFRSFRARSVNLATLFLGKPPRQFTST